MEPHLKAAQQYFPTYKLDPKRTEIGLREYDLAAKALEADQRSLTAAAGIALFFGGTAVTVLGSSGVTSLFDRLVNRLGTEGWTAAAGAVAIIALLLTHYFARLQRSATHAARKIVVLRRLLGLDYGNIETVLPAETLDGANEPFAIRMFPGWKSLQAIPELAVAVLSGFAQSLLTMAFVSKLEASSIPFNWSILASGILMTCTSLMFFRLSLLEDYENIRFLTAKWAAHLLRVPLKPRTGHVLYRIRLAIFEAERLKLDLTVMHAMLIHIEDRDFYRHKGNSWKAIVAAGWRYLQFSARSGGSTILQQLARSNFLTTLRPKFRRKVIEWLLAPWLNRQFSKIEALNAYLVSVRYAHRVFGIVEAIKHFFPNHDLSVPLPPHMQFILVERLSNTSGRFPAPRVKKLVQACKAQDLLADSDIHQLNTAYADLGRRGRIDLMGVRPNLQ